MITVPDERLDILQGLVKPQKVAPTAMEFVDIAGLVKGASRGEGLGNQFLANIREVDAVIHVIRCFDDENVTHVSGTVDPLQDKEIIDTELLLKDLASVEKRIENVEKTAKSGDKQAKTELEILFQFKKHLEAGMNANLLKMDQGLRDFAQKLQLLTDKPAIYVANVDENSVVSGNKWSEKLTNALKQENIRPLLISAGLEAQIAAFEDQEERNLFLAEYGLEESGLNHLIKTSYQLLDLVTFFTAGEQEVRAWTIKRNWKAPRAAGVIHSDFEKGFIKASVIKLKDYQKYKSEAGCREAGKLAMEGKEYEVQDGDVIFFHFNV